MPSSAAAFRGDEQLAVELLEHIEEARLIAAVELFLREFQFRERPRPASACAILQSDHGVIFRCSVAHAEVIIEPAKHRRQHFRKISAIRPGPASAPASPCIHTPIEAASKAATPCASIARHAGENVADPAVASQAGAFAEIAALRPVAATTVSAPFSTTVAPDTVAACAPAPASSPLATSPNSGRIRRHAGSAQRWRSPQRLR